MDVQTKLSDLDMLYDYKKDAAVAATGYLAMATESHHDKIRDRFLALSAASVMTQEKASDLIAQLGGIS